MISVEGTRPPPPPPIFYKPEPQVIPSFDTGLPQAFTGLFEQWRYKCFHGGRGSGKSTAFAKVLIILASQAPLRVLCCREIQKSINDSVFQLLVDQIKEMGLEYFFNVKGTEITGANGSRFFFRGLFRNIDSIKSIEGIDICWVEEAHTISAESLRKLIPTIRKVNSEIWFSYNPELPTDAVDILLRGEHPPKNTLRVEVNHEDNPYFPEVLKDEMELDFKRDPEMAGHVWGGKYLTISKATVFRNWKVQEFDSPDDDPYNKYILGCDHGFSVDPVTLVRGFLTPDKKRLYLDYEAYEVGTEIDNLEKLFVDNVPRCKQWTIRADSARPELNSHLRRRGFKIVGAVKGPKSVEEGIRFVQNLDLIIHPRCRNIIRELTLYKFKICKDSGDVLPVLEDKNNHCIDAIRYMVEGVRRGHGIQDVL